MASNPQFSPTRHLLGSIPGIGPVTIAVVCFIGDLGRFAAYANIHPSWRQPGASLNFARRMSPLLFDASHGEEDGLECGFGVGEVPARADGLSDAAIEVLDGVGVDESSDVGGEGEEGDDGAPVAPPSFGDRGILAPEFAVGEGIELSGGAVGVNGVVDAFKFACDLSAILVGDEARGVAQQVEDAGLDDGAGEGGLNGLGEALEVVDDGDQDVVDAAGAQVVEDPLPELGALGFGEPQAENFTVAVGAHADGQIQGLIGAPRSSRILTRMASRKTSGQQLSSGH